MPDGIEPEAVMRLTILSNPECGTEMQDKGTSVQRIDLSGYRYAGEGHSHAHSYLLPAVLRVLGSLNLPDSNRRIFDVGCGNGSVANALTERGWDITGVDPSVEGIGRARAAYPGLKLALGSAYDDLAAEYGQFPVVLSLEVVEHVYAPRAFARSIFDLLTPSGTAIVSTPYHGYWKNLALAATGRMDAHFTALWDHGHIKFWSIKTLTQLLRGAGFRSVKILRVGRLPVLAKSMVAICRKGPEGPSD